MGGGSSPDSGLRPGRRLVGALAGQRSGQLAGLDAGVSPVLLISFELIVPSGVWMVSIERRGLQNWRAFVVSLCERYGGPVIHPPGIPPTFGAMSVGF